MEVTQFPLLFLKDGTITRRFGNKGGGGSDLKVPMRDRQQHAAFLRSALDQAWAASETAMEQRGAISIPARDGIYLEFTSSPEMELKLESLENNQAGIKLLSYRTVNNVAFATVYVPRRSRSFYLRRINQYQTKETKWGKPQHRELIESIELIRSAIVESFWTDDRTLIPREARVPCEVWLALDDAAELSTEIGPSRTSLLDTFSQVCTNLGVDVLKGSLSFPDRLVVAIMANYDDLAEISESSDNIAEFRRVKETARFFLEIPNREQAEWVSELASRIQIEENTTTAVCVLDTGANSGHPLLTQILSDNDCHTVEPAWGVDDRDGHGTNMCGVVAFGNLTEALESNRPIDVYHWLESAKILQSNVSNDPKLYGYITSQAVSRAEIAAPDRSRVVCLAVTAKDGRDSGRPSSWSAALDNLTSGADDDTKRLIVVAAGNLDRDEIARYPISNQEHPVHDPGQSWNALTVGAYTNLVRVTHPDFQSYGLVAISG